MDQQRSPTKLKVLPRYEHFPVSSPTVVGAARSWHEAFAMATDLLRKGQLTGISITRSDEYPQKKRFLISRLSDRGDPAAVVRWMAQHTPLIYAHITGVDLYLNEGQIITPDGTEPSWRLDLVFH